jgi:uncharacterized membrane protein
MQQTLSPGTKRIESIDLLRGLVMIIMALDHVRDFFHIGALTDDPLNLMTTTPQLYFTRWITHFCAPVFVFLTGTSAYLQAARKSKKELSLFLIKRGLWLIIAELTIINLIFSFDITFSQIALTVIWAIGISMVILGLLIWLPFKLILAIGIVIVAGHNSLDFYERTNPGPHNVMYNLLHSFGVHPLWGKHLLLVMYPFLPWTGLMILGYCLGRVLRNSDEASKKKFLIITGLSAIVLFIVFRFINVYGNPFPWAEQRTAFYSFLSFINTHKYPPSLFYMCMTIGPALLFIALWGNIQNGFSRVVSVYGRVPFFYYILHFFVIHLLATIVFFMRGHSFAEGVGNPASFANFVKAGEGFSLGVTYLIWLGIVIMLYPLCKWYDNYKMNHKEKWWLSYL